jgi:hypothetical protein
MLAVAWRVGRKFRHAGHGAKAWSARLAIPLAFLLGETGSE